MLIGNPFAQIMKAILKYKDSPKVFVSILARASDGFATCQIVDEDTNTIIYEGSGKDMEAAVRCVLMKLPDSNTAT